jgi:hypothetical protein
LPLGPMLCSHVIFLFKWWMGGFSRFLNAMYVWNLPTLPKSTF